MLKVPKCKIVCLLWHRAKCLFRTKAGLKVMETFLFINRLTVKLLQNFLWVNGPKCKMIGEGQVKPAFEDYHYYYYQIYIKVHTATIIIITIIIIIIILIVCIMAYEVILLWPWDAVIALPFSIYQTKIINFSFKCKRSKEHKHTVRPQFQKFDVLWPSKCTEQLISCFVKNVISCYLGNRCSRNLTKL